MIKAWFITFLKKALNYLEPVPMPKVGIDISIGQHSLPKTSAIASEPFETTPTPVEESKVPELLGEVIVENEYPVSNQSLPANEAEGFELIPPLPADFILEPETPNPVSEYQEVIDKFSDLYANIDIECTRCISNSKEEVGLSYVKEFAPNLYDAIVNYPELIPMTTHNFFITRTDKDETFKITAK